MGVVLPDYLTTALDLIGVSWPNVDEDDYRHMAQTMREFADSLENGTADIHNALQEMLGANEGPAIEALSSHWDTVKGKHLTTLVQVSRGAGTGLDAVAVLIEGAKLAAIAQLGILASEITAALAAAPLTLGASALAGVAGQQVCRVAVKRILKEVERAVVDEITSRVMAPIEEALGAMAGDLVVQFGSVAVGLQGGVDLGRTADAGKASLKLASAGSGAGTGGGDGSPATGRIRVDLKAYAELEKSLGEAGRHLGGHTAGKLAVARQHQARTRGKDAIANAANSAVDKALDGIGQGLAKAGKHLGDDMRRGIGQMRTSHEKHDRSAAEAFRGMGSRAGGGDPHPAGGQGPGAKPRSASSTPAALPAAPERLALPPGSARLSLQQVRNIRDRRRRWQAGEDHVREQYGAGPERAYPVATNSDPRFPVTTPGGRKVDAPVDLPGGGTLAVEVKTYQQYRRVEAKPGTWVTKYVEVPLTEKIREQIAKDVALREADPGFDPRWVFLHATPGDDLRGHLTKAGIIFVEHHIPKK